MNGMWFLVVNLGNVCDGFFVQVNVANTAGLARQWFERPLPKSDEIHPPPPERWGPGEPVIG